MLRQNDFTMYIQNHILIDFKSIKIMNVLMCKIYIEYSFYGNI